MIKFAFTATIAICAIAATTTSASARPRLSQDERVIYGQMEAAELNDQLVQYKIDLARARCERNGGSFDMNEVRFIDNVNTRRNVRSRDRGAVYQDRRGRTTINLSRLIFGPPPPEVDIRSNYNADVRITNRACRY
jgi:hypothetical protein